MRVLYPCTALLLLMVAATASAQQWERIDNHPIQAPHVGGVAAADDKYLYQTLIFGPPSQLAFFRSTDNGATWTRTITIPSQAVVPKYFSALSGYLIMGGVDDAGENGVFLISNSWGASWEEVKTPLGKKLRSINSVFAGVHIAGIAGDKPIRSNDGGETWKPVMTGPIDLQYARGIGSKSVAVSSSGFVYRSTDLGSSWEQVNINPPNPTVLNLATSLWVSDSLFMVKKQGGPIFVSADGATWSMRSGPIGDSAYTTVETSPNGKAWLLSGGNGLYLSTDAGKTVVDISAGYPREEGSGFCAADFTLTNTAVHTSATCTTAPSGGGTFRYMFPAASVDDRRAAENAAADLRATRQDGIWRIDYSVPAAGAVRITLSDNSARQVATLLDGQAEAGSHVMSYDAGHLPSGIYWMTIQAGGASVTRKMVEVR